MPEEKTKRQNPEGTKSVAMNPEGIDKGSQTFDNDKERGKPSRDPVNNANNENVNIVGPHKDNDAELAKEQVPEKPPVPMERKHAGKRGDGGIGKLSEAPTNIVRPARKDRTIPEKDNLAVRYVKMRNHKLEDSRESEEGKESESTAEGSKISDKVLESILGVKAERKEGERWVKLSEVDLEGVKQEVKGGKTDEHGTEMEGREEKLLKSVLNLKVQGKEVERSVKLTQVDDDDAREIGKGGETKDCEREVKGKEVELLKDFLSCKAERNEGEGSVKLGRVDVGNAEANGKGKITKDNRREMEGREDKLNQSILGGNGERKESEMSVKLSEVDVDDVKTIGKAGKTKDDNREMGGKENNPSKNILDLKTERKEEENSVKLSEVDVDGSKEIKKGWKTKDYEREMEGRDDKLFKNILGFLAERKERDKLREVEVKDEEDIDKDKKAKNDGVGVEGRKENVGRKEEGKTEEGRRNEEKIEEGKRENKSNARKFSADKMGARLVRTRNLVRTDCITLAKGIRARRKEQNASLKYSLERRIENAERILEDRVGNFLEETAEKHPWLQPIENWVVDRYKSARSPKSPPSVSTSLILESEHEKVSETVIKEDKEDDDEGSDSGEVFIESVKKSAKKSDSACSSKDSAESSPELSKSRGKGNGKKEETTATEKIDKVERSHHVDLLDKLRDGFKEKVEDVQRYFQRTSRLADVNRKLKSQIWSSVVTIVLVEAKNLLPMDIDGLSDPYVKFRLGTEKYKSKVVNKTLSPVWLEQFDLHLYEDPYLGQELEVTVWDRDKSHQDDLMGRTTIDLASMERETTHRLWRDLEDGAGNIYLLLTISGTTASETISDLAAHEETPQERSRLLQKYSLRNSLQRPKDVGHLTVKVYRAQGLAAADLGGKSDPFCVLELVNARLQTQTEYKTLAPNWQKIFTFNVKDINSVLEVTVYDEDRDHKVEFLGRVAIPLLRIRNAEKRWYALKDKKLRGRAKGNSPQIMLEMIVVWNVFRACARTLNPKEKKYMEPEVKFKRQVFLRNVLRLKAIIVIFIDMGKYIQSCWEWESKTRSIVALVLFVLLCYYFEPWMIPTAALLILMKYCMVAMLTGGSLTTSYQHSPSVGQLHDSGDGASDEGPATPGDDDDDEDDKDKEEKKSLKERLQAIQEVTQTVQNSIGFIASLCERIKNLFNFTVPYLSYLAMFLTILGVIVLYFIPMRYLILAWGVNKFLRKLLRPHSVPNNEVLDLISRVPDDEDLLSYRELKPVPTADCERGGTSSTSSATTVATRRDLRKKHKAA